MVLEQLIERTCRELARERRGILRLRCRFEIERRPACELVIGMYRPTAEARHVAELARLKLESLRFGDCVTAIRLTVLAADRLEYRQQEIFSGQGPGIAPRRANWPRWSTA